MDSTVLQEVIEDQQRAIRAAEINPRDVAFDPAANYVLVGMRRAGKSTLLYSRARDLVAQGVDWSQIIYINFEDERLLGFDVSDFNDIVILAHQITDKEPIYFFDEIQNIPGWEKFVRRLADSKQRVYVTGSNAKMLSRDVATTLGGRYLILHVDPYNFQEFLRARDMDVPTGVMASAQRGEVRAALAEYYQYGGFPEAVELTAKREYVESVYQKVLLSDIAARHNVRSVNALRLMMMKLSEVIGRPLSTNTLASQLSAAGAKTSKDTVATYLDHVQDAFMVFRLTNEYSKFAERESVPKYYFADNGLVGLFRGVTDSALLENLVAVTLRQRYGEELHFAQSQKTDVDVDFVVEPENLAVQVAYSVQGPAREREVNALIRLQQNSPRTNWTMMIVTYEERETIETEAGTIQVVPLEDFLLNIV